MRPISNASARLRVSRELEEAPRAPRLRSRMPPRRPGDKPHPHVDEGERGQVAFGALSALQHEEHDGRREERLYEHEAETVGGADTQKA